MFIGMIWRPTPDRMVAFNRTVDFWNQLGDVHFFDSGHQIFNRAASRNMAVRAAEKAGHWKLVLTDADTIPEHRPVLDAFASVNDRSVRLPYNVCRVLDTSDRPLGEFGFTCGGVYVTTVNGWFDIGGQDELFTRWAPEDFAFKLAHETLKGEMVRHDGVLLSLGHGVGERANSESDPEVQLYRRYERAHGDVDAMKALCFPS